MTLPRKQLISISDTPYYHITNRYVRRAYLCGHDDKTNRSYEHRRQWIVDRLKFLDTIFTIDICAYAIMHNHYHLVLKVNSNEPSLLGFDKGNNAIPSTLTDYLSLVDLTGRALLEDK